MKVFEHWGVEKLLTYLSLHQKQDTPYRDINALFDTKKIYLFSFFAFLVGLLMTIPIIYMELEYHIFSFDTVSVWLLVGYLVVFLFFVFLEFYLLFLLGFYLLSYFIHHLVILYNEKHTEHIQEKGFLMMLVRTVMELPEPDIIRYNINHKEDKDNALLVWTLLYKLKVIMTNLVLKFVAKKAFTRTSFRLYTPYIAALGTGLWDGIVFYKTMRHSQYKLMVRLVVIYLWEQKKALLMQESYTKVLLARYFYYGEYNSNLDYLLTQIYETQAFTYSSEAYKEEESLHKVDKNFIALLYALKEKRYTKKEREVIAMLGIKEQERVISKALKRGDFTYLFGVVDGVEEGLM